ncbi:MAG: GntR family transcriptional regulator [Chloroflexota bacterium]
MQDYALPALRETATTLSEQVYSALLAAIVEQRLSPGARLTLDDLAAQLKVSRTPVRDAVARLAMEGLVQPSDRRGFSVTVLGAEALAELFDMRLMCELFAVETGLGRVTPTLLERMESLAHVILVLNRSEDPTDVIALALKDKALHRMIVGLAGNRRLSELYERLSIHVQTYRVRSPLLRGPAVEAAFRLEHGAIIAALQGGQVGPAKEAVRAHVLNAKQRALRAVVE